MPARRARLAEQVASVVGAALLVVVLGEVATRVLNRDGHVYDLEMFKYSRELKQDAPPGAADMHHWHLPGRTARLQGVDVSINSKGLRDHEHSYAAAPGVRRILVLGDSITLGWGVAMEDTYPKVLERLLNADGRGRYEVVNGGVGNYTLSRMIGLYHHELFRYGAPVVLVSFFINNANETPDGMGRVFFDTPLQFPVFLWSRALRVAARYHLVRDFDRYYADLYAEGSSTEMAFRSRLRSFLHELHADGKVTVVASIPDVYHLRESRYHYQYVTDEVFSAAREESAHTVDLFPSVQGMAPEAIMNTPEDRHPNAEGHRRFARALHDAFVAFGI
jgi:lysophospholipase L1-like esterase